MSRAAPSLRPAGPDDARLLFEWANDPLVRAMAFHTAPITWASHLIWLQKKLADPNCHIWIACVAGRPVGQIRFDLQNEVVAEVDVHTSPADRGFGIGPLIIRAGVEDLFARTGVQTITAVVKCENKGSSAAFVKAGFGKSGSCYVHGIECERLILQRS